MTELLTTVIQVGGLTRRKTWFNPPFPWGEGVYEKGSKGRNGTFTRYVDFVNF